MNIQLAELDLCTNANSEEFKNSEARVVMAWTCRSRFAVVLVTVILIAAEAAPYVRPPARKTLSIDRRKSQIQQVSFTSGLGF